jgi:GTP-binding protein
MSSQRRNQRQAYVALVGRPNVGKSTLFNRFIGERRAVVDDRPGTTRDRIYGESDWRDTTFTVIDTGGIEVYRPHVDRNGVLAEDSGMFLEEMLAQVRIALQDADVIVMLVSATDGLTAADSEVAQLLRRTEKPVVLAVNKVDNAGRMDDTYEFYELGLGEFYPLSAIHGTGTGDLLDAVYDAMPDWAKGGPIEVIEDDRLHIAIVGRPNVGKSSLLNKILGQDRVIVSPVSGTTRDAIDTVLRYEGEEIVLIDTAGIRRRGHVTPGVEKYSVLRAMRAIERCDVALLVLDAGEGITSQDAHIAGYILEQHKSVIVVVNKWDIVEKDTHTMHEYTQWIRDRLRFMDYVPIMFISALTGQRVSQVIPTAIRIHEERLVRVPTSELNEIVREAVQLHPAPSRQGRQLKIYYVTQVSVDPPTFLFHVNDTRLVHFTYERFLENQIRERYGFFGTPIRLSFRPRESDRIGRD